MFYLLPGLSAVFVPCLLSLLGGLISGLGCGNVPDFCGVFVLRFPWWCLCPCPG